MLTPPFLGPPAAPTRMFALTGEEYSLVVAALRLLEDDLTDADDPEARGYAAEAVALRAKLRTQRDRAPSLAVVVPIRAGDAR